VSRGQGGKEKSGKTVTELLSPTIVTCEQQLRKIEGCPLPPCPFPKTPQGALYN
jgi:hypothetical protein